MKDGLVIRQWLHCHDVTGDNKEAGSCDPASFNWWIVPLS